MSPPSRASAARSSGTSTLPRVLRLCELKQGDGPLKGYAAVTHGHLAAACLMLIEAPLSASLRHPTERRSRLYSTGRLAPPNRRLARRAATSPPSTSPSIGRRLPGSAGWLSRGRSARAAVDAMEAASHPQLALLPPEQLAVIMACLRLAAGAVHGSACIWLPCGRRRHLWRAGCGRGAVGGSRALSRRGSWRAPRAIGRRGRVRRCGASATSRERWRALVSAAPTLLKLLGAQHAINALRRSALGCVSLMLKQGEPQPPLIQMHAPQLLRQLAATAARPVEQRLTATRSLDEAVGNVAVQTS